MKKLLLTAALAILGALTLGAQSVIMQINEDMFAKSTADVVVRVVDAGTKAPIGFASVYLHHPKDTIITDFVLSGHDGVARLEGVATGEHVIVVEQMGYRPAVKEFNLRENLDLGTVGLDVDAEMLEAAKVSAAATPMEIRKDTIIYNAAAFKTLQGANLADLLKKMPGIEVGNDGSVKVNGESVSQITVGGRTFFVGDNQVALNNIPAHIVDKVKVIDKDSETAQFTGIKEKDREKVMDVELKEEYKKGFFGNAKLGLGSSFPSKNQSEYIENKAPLYQASTMLSQYSEKRQLTTLGNLANVNTGGTVFMSFGGGGDLAENTSLSVNDVRSALGPSWSVGTNLNSDDIKGFSTDASVLYKGANQHTDKHTEQTNYQQDSYDIDSDSESYTQRRSDDVKIKAELKNKSQKKYLLNFSPSFSAGRVNTNSSTETKTRSGDSELNNVSMSTDSKSNFFDLGSYLKLGVKNLGKPRRALTLTGTGNVSGSDGKSVELNSALKDLNYSSLNAGLSMGTTLEYIEPIGEKWAISAEARAYRRKRKNTRNAFDLVSGASDDYYSSYNLSRYRSGSGSLLLQYNGEITTLSFGTEVKAINSETDSRGYSIDTQTGKGIWDWTFSPYLWLRTEIKDYGLFVSYSTDSYVPSAGDVLSNFSIYSPTSVGIGNIYLKPNYQNGLLVNVSKTYEKTGINLDLSSNFSFAKNERVRASWFDANGVQYFVPVNSKKGGNTYYHYLVIMAPLDKSKKLRLSWTNYARLVRNVSYQSKGILPGLDLDTFNYSDFIADFWGDASGDRFYSGESGFEQSLTRRYTSNNTLKLQRNFEHFSMALKADVSHTKTSYSLNSAANTNVWAKAASLDLSYSTPKQYEFATEFTYRNYSGYRDGFNHPEYKWDFSAAKSIKAFLITAKVYNILNQHSGRIHNVGENYVQDGWYNTLGRYFLISVRYNFGKADAAKKMSAQSAQWKMM